MKQVMLSVIPGVTIAIVIAAGYFAYKHPLSFKMLFLFLLGGTTFVFAFLVGHDVGSLQTQKALADLIATDQVAEMRSKLSAAVLFFSSLWDLAFLLAWVLYLNFLRYVLPLVLRFDSEEAWNDPG